jgi:hypothetical protein
VNEQSPADLAGLLGSLVQQQTAIFQQQTALLQVHGESLRLQRLLVERLLGGAATAEIGGSTSHPEPPPWMSAPVAPNSAPLSTVMSVPDVHHAAPSPFVEDTTVTVKVVVEPSPAPAPEPAAATPSAGVGVGENAGHSARYYQSRPASAIAPVQPQDLELMRRLHEMRDASSLLLQFGPHKGESLAQVAMNDPDYVRQLVIRAQRPEVRAAAGRLVEAMEAAAEHKRRTARATSRRTRPSL